MPPRSQAIDALWHCLCPSASLVPANGSFGKKALSWGEGAAAARPRSMSRSLHKQSTRCPSNTVNGSVHQHRPKPRLSVRRHHRSQARWMETQAQVAEQTYRPYEGPAPSPKSGASPWRRQIRRALREGLVEVPGRPPPFRSKRAVQPSQLDDVQNRPRFDFETLDGSELEAQLQKAIEAVNYAAIHSIVNALVEGHGEPPDYNLYTALLHANADPANGSAREVRNLLANMVEDELPPNSAAYHAALLALSIHTDHLLRASILDDMSSQWIELSPDGHHSVLAGLLRDRQVEQALLLLHKMQSSGMRIRAWLYDIVCYTLLEAGDVDYALRLIQQRVAAGETNISGALWSHLLDTAAQARHYAATAYVWTQRVQDEYLNPPSGVCVNVLNVAARAGDFHLATDVVRILARRSTALQLCHYEPLLEAYLAADDLRSALSIVLAMPGAGVPPRDATMRPLFAYLRASPERVHAALQALHALHGATRQDVPTACVNVLLEAFVELRDLDAAVAVYKVMHRLGPAGPDTRTFNTLLRGCTYARRRETALFFAAEMLARRVRPDALTYDRLILVCVASTAPGDGRRGLASALAYWREMVGERLAARRGTVGMLVKRCVEEGDARGWDVLEQGEATGLDLRGLRGWVEGGGGTEREVDRGKVQQQQQQRLDWESRRRELVKEWREGWERD